MRSDVSNRPAHVADDVVHSEFRATAMPDGEDGEALVEQRVVIVRRQDSAFRLNLPFSQEPKPARWHRSKLLQHFPARLPSAAQDRDDCRTITYSGAINVE